MCQVTCRDTAMGSSRKQGCTCLPAQGRPPSWSPEPPPPPNTGLLLVSNVPVSVQGWLHHYLAVPVLPCLPEPRRRKAIPVKSSP